MNSTISHLPSPISHSSLANEAIQISGQRIAQQILDVVSEQFRIPVKVLLGFDRPLHLVVAREIAVHLARSRTYCHVERLGRVFNREPKTIYAVCEAAQRDYDTSKAFRARYDRIAKIVDEYCFDSFTPSHVGRDLRDVRPSPISHLQPSTR